MRYEKAVTDIIELAHKHAQFTTEKVLGKDDAEVGLDFLLGKMDRWL